VRRVVAAGLAVLVLTAGTPGGAGSAAATTSQAGRATTPAPAAPLPAPPGRTTLLSKARGGGFPAGSSIEPAMSADGRYVAFTSIATDLVRKDDPGTVDVFLLDRRSGRTSMAPLPAGVPRTTQTTATEPSISADGRFVAFTYLAPTPVGTTAALPRQYIVLWNVRSDVSVFAATNSRGTPMLGRQPSLSDDGRYLAFTTTLDLPGDKDGGQDDVVRWDRRSGDVVLVSSGIFGRPISGVANAPSISGDGNLVAFVSDGGDSVIAEDTGSGFQVYVRDIDADRTEQVSRTRDGRPPRGEATDPAISRNGRYVAFASRASNLTDEGAAGLFRRDLQADRTIMVSVTPDGAAADGSHAQPSITGDGNMVAWTSTATNLVPETAGRIAPAASARLATDVYLRDIAAGETVLVSVSLVNGPSGGRSFQSSVGGDGRYVAFASDSPQLVDRDTNKAFDAFLRDLPPLPVINPSTLDLGSRAVDTESLPLAATLGNGGWTPLRVTGARISGPNRDDFRIVADGCRARVLRRNEACTVSVVFRPRGKGTRTATLEVADGFAGSPRTVRLRGRASQASLELDPPIGPPGIVTIVTGSGFPPGTAVSLSWSRGITPTMDPVVTDARGAFRVPVLVFHNDRTGARELLAASLDGTAFPSVSATMLVTRPSVVPPRFELLRFIDLPFVLVIRG